MGVAESRRSHGCSVVTGGHESREGGAGGCGGGQRWDREHPISSGVEFEGCGVVGDGETPGGLPTGLILFGPLGPGK